MFFVTFLPQFVSPERSARAGKLVFLGLTFVVVAVADLRPDDPLRRAPRRALSSGSPRVMRAVDWLFASVFSGFAVKLLLTSRK